MPPKDQKGSNFIELYKNRGHQTELELMRQEGEAEEMAAELTAYFLRHTGSVVPSHSVSDIVRRLCCRQGTSWSNQMKTRGRIDRR
jgi:hypothetical protein